MQHLNEYLNHNQVRLSLPLRLALTTSRLTGGLLGGLVRSQVTRMARIFMLGNEEQKVAETLQQLNDNDIAFTLDVLGETVVSEAEAEAYAARYLNLMNELAQRIAQWTHDCRSNITPRGDMARLNLSLKISAFCSQLIPTDPEGTIERIAVRIRPILRRAKELGAAITFDMESYDVKDLTLRLFKSIFCEAEFADGPECGLAVQAYLKECETDLRELVTWARNQKRLITIRLVKGAYWDYEAILARQRGWPVPVFGLKAETDANYERLCLYLLENEDAVVPAFGTHNVRSMAWVMAQAQRLGVNPRIFEFQMLYGMSEALQEVLMQMGCRVRIYCPVGELLPGMAYLVRRLLENTSNEGFLANTYIKSADRETLLRNPVEIIQEHAAASTSLPGESHTPDAPGFKNEPPVDFTLASERGAIHDALRELRSKLGRRYPLVINHKRIETAEWTSSINPANQEEIIGHTACATIKEAEMALQAAIIAQRSWGHLPAAQRCNLCHKLANLMRRDKAKLTALCILEAGKNWIESDADVAEALDFCNFYAAIMRDMGQPHRTQYVPGETNLEQWWPRGVGVVIAPWNFPLSLLTGMMTAAVVAGNTVLLKPSEQTPVIAAQLMELVVEAGFPPGVINLVTGHGSDVGAYLVEHGGTDFVAFTGSKAVGLKIWETAGRTPKGQMNLKKVICEMGGKNAMIIDSDADLDEAVAGIIHSAFGYSGQKCSALSRVIVLEENYDRFLERLIPAAASLTIGPAEQPGNTLGPVIDRTAQQRILSVIEAGQQEAHLAWQGQVPNNSKACYVPPVIFTEVPPGSRLFQEEIFGPVLSITRAKDFKMALALANDSVYALTGGIYSRNPTHIEQAKAHLVCGNLYVNRGITGAIVGRQPFGGFKMSGGGTKAGGREYLQNFLIPRIITENCMRRGFAPIDTM